MSINRSGNNTVYGFNNPLQKLPSAVIFAERDPETTDRASLGSMWINTENNSYFFLTSANTWTAQNQGSSTVSTLTITGGSGTVLTVEPNGNTSLGGDLAVDGATSLSDTLLVQGAATFNSQVDIDSNSLVDIQSSSNTYPSIRIQTDGGASEGLFIVSQQGEGNHAGGDPAILVQSVAGGVDILATKEIFIQSDSTSTLALRLSASAGSISLSANKAFSASSGTTTAINSVGNWSASSQAELALSSVGNMSLISSSNNADSVIISANAGSQERVTIVSNLGEGTGSSLSAAIGIVAASGGIVCVAEKQVVILSNASGSNSIKIQADTSTASDSLNIVSAAGGITLNAATSVSIEANNTGMISLQSKVVNDTSFSPTNNALVGKIILTNVTLAVSASQVIVVSNTEVSATSAVLVSAFIYSPVNNAQAVISNMQIDAGSFEFTLTNDGSGNLLATDTINIAFQVL